MSGEVSVHARLPREHYKALYALSQTHGLSVEALVRECVRRQLPGIVPADIPEPKRVVRVTRAHVTAAGVARSPITEDDLTWCRSLLDEGLSTSEIAERMARPRSSIYKLRHRLGRPPAPRT